MERRGSGKWHSILECHRPAIRLYYAPCLCNAVVIMTADTAHDAPDLFSYRKYWAKRFGTAPFLPKSRAEMEQLGWDSCAIIIVTGAAYVDHPSFGMAVIGRALAAQGFRVGILAQPDWTSARDFMRLGRPNLFFGVPGRNMDSIVNRYTSDRKIRSYDAYTPHGAAGDAEEQVRPAEPQENPGAGPIRLGEAA